MTLLRLWMMLSELVALVADILMRLNNLSDHCLLIEIIRGRTFPESSTWNETTASRICKLLIFNEDCVEKSIVMSQLCLTR